MRHTFITISLLSMALFSCEPGGEFTSDAKGVEYFPLQTGNFIVYDVDSIGIASNVQTQDRYQMKVEVMGEFMNAAGQKSFIIQRFKRTEIDFPWIPVSSGSAWIDARSAVEANGNQRIVKLKFPLEVGVEWNGNEMNNAGGDDDCSGIACDRYEVTEIDPQVVVVQSEIEDVLVKYDVRKEVFARDIGLVYKEMTVLEYCTSQGCFGKQFVEKGLIYKQTMVEHGKI